MSVHESARGHTFHDVHGGPRACPYTKFPDVRDASPIGRGDFFVDVLARSEDDCGRVAIVVITNRRHGPRDSVFRPRHAPRGAIPDAAYPDCQRHAHDTGKVRPVTALSRIDKISRPCRLRSPTRGEGRWVH